MASFKHDVLASITNNFSSAVWHGDTAAHKACTIEYFSKRGLPVDGTGQALLGAPASQEFDAVWRQTRAGTAFSGALSDLIPQPKLSIMYMSHSFLP